MAIKIDKTITFGNILTLATIIGSVIGIFIDVSTKVNAGTQKLHELDVKVQSLEQIKEDVAEIKVDNKWLRDILMEIKQDFKDHRSKEKGP